MSLNNSNKYSNTGYYEVSTKKVIPRRFGIQVASFKEATNLIKRCDDIKNLINKKITENMGRKMYIIIGGPFLTWENANDFNSKLKNYFSGSFVFSF